MQEKSEVRESRVNRLDLPVKGFIGCVSEPKVQILPHHLVNFVCEQYYEWDAPFVDVGVRAGSWATTTQDHDNDHDTTGPTQKWSPKDARPIQLIGVKMTIHNCYIKICKELELQNRK